MRMARVLLPPSVPCRRAQHWPRARGGQARTTGKKKAASWMEAAPRGSANQAAPGRVPMRWGTGTACSGGHALGRAGNLERLTDVGQDVVAVLDAHRQSQVSRRHAGGALVLRAGQIGRPSGRAGGCQYVKNTVVAGPVKKKHIYQTQTYVR